MNLARAGARHHDPAGAAYDSAQWHDLFVACAGAEAALAGLAVSINLQSVLAYPGLPARALETLALLIGVGAPRAWLVTRLTLVAAGTVPFLVAGPSLIAGARGGLYWTLAGIVGAFVGAVSNAWGAPGRDPTVSPGVRRLGFAPATEGLQ